MSASAFVDSNILVYAHDLDAGRKHGIAQRVVHELWNDRTGLVSTQVLHEFYVNVTGKIAAPLPKATARALVFAYASWCLAPALDDISMAFQIEDEARIGFWDALIIASAVRGGVTRLISEDLNAGQLVRGIRIENPFAVIP